MKVDEGKGRKTSEIHGWGKVLAAKETADKIRLLAHKTIEQMGKNVGRKP